MIPFLLSSVWFILTGCVVTTTGDLATSTPEFVTATLPPSPIPFPTLTLPPPTPLPTIAPIEGTTTTQVNVRASTSTGSDTLGTIPQFSKVQVIGRDSSTNWYQIIYSDSPTGAGWVRAEYVQVNAAAEIPVLGSGAVSGPGGSGVVIQKINVRSGPATSFEILGELNPNDVVFIFAKDESGEWAEIEYANSAEGKGWVALKFLQVESADSLPTIVTVVETPVNVVASPGNTSLPALLDGDSKEFPLASITFSALGAGSMQISGDVSSPDGDGEDWVEFTTNNGNVAIQLVCPAEAPQVELWKMNEIVERLSLACGEKRYLKLDANETYLLRLSVADTTIFQHTNFTLILQVVQIR